MPFAWKLKPSSAGALLGYNKYKTREQALAEAWREKKPAQFKIVMKMLRATATKEEQAKAVIRKSAAIQEAIQVGVCSGSRKGRAIAIDNIKLEAYAGVQTRSQRLAANNVVKQARSEMYKANGIRREDSGIQRSAKKQKKTFEAGNKKFYKLDLPGSPHAGVMWGLIDGFDHESGTIIEHKQRQNRIFHSIPRYERIQCFIYMKMLDVKRVQLIQTFEDEQREDMIYWDPDEWRTIHEGLVTCIEDLNRTQRDGAWRKTLVKSLL